MLFCVVWTSTNMDVDIISSRDLLPVVAVVTAVGGEQPFRQVSLPQHPGTVCNAK